MATSRRKTTTMATRIDDDTLQRYYDGDLSPVEEHGMQLRIEGDPDAQRRLTKLAKLTELMQTSADELGQHVDSKVLFSGIEARLADAGKPGFGARLRVVGGEWLEHRRATLMPIVAASAVAAATFLVVTRSDGPTESGGPEGRVVATTDAVHGSVVENVDFGSNTGTVFEIEDRGVAVAVVWITEDEESQ